MASRWHPPRCKVCHKRKEEVGHITASGLCIEHALQRAEDNHNQLRAHSGPWFDHWRRRSLAALGVVIDTDDR